MSKFTGNAFPIRAFVGENGSGKSLACVERVVLPAWREGRPVVSNMTLYPERVGFDRDLYVPLTSWRQIVDLSGCALVLDEITSVLPSRQAMSLPPQLGRILNQLRKGDVWLGWTAPSWMRADVLLREVTQAVTDCRGRFPDGFAREVSTDDLRWLPKALRDEDGRRVRWEKGWPPNRLFFWATYRGWDFDEFTFHASKDVKPVSVQRYWRTKHVAHLAYDTLEGVGLLDHLDDVGLCVVCGGSRSRPKCKCDATEAPGVRGDVGARTPGPLDDRNPRGPIRRLTPRPQPVAPR